MQLYIMCSNLSNYSAFNLYFNELYSFFKKIITLRNGSLGNESCYFWTIINVIVITI